jgi:hypothetical protein
MRVRALVSFLFIILSYINLSWIENLFFLFEMRQNYYAEKAAYRKYVFQTENMQNRFLCLMIYLLTSFNISLHSSILSVF